MTNPKNIGMMLVAVAAAMSIGLVTIGFQSTIAIRILADVDIEEDVEAGNATMMMTNQTAGGNMTGGTNSTS